MYVSDITYITDIYYKCSVGRVRVSVTGHQGGGVVMGDSLVGRMEQVGDQG